MGEGRSLRIFGYFSLGRICLPGFQQTRRSERGWSVTSHSFGGVKDQPVGSISDNSP